MPTFILKCQFVCYLLIPSAVSHDLASLLEIGIYTSWCGYRFADFVAEPVHLVNVDERWTRWEVDSGTSLRHFTQGEVEHLNNAASKMK